MRPRVPPKGVGELLVLRQQFVEYQLGEAAHVENVMSSEKREREHRRVRQEEEFTERSVTREEESLRDVQTTERFELERETNAVVRSQEEFQAGANVSASYGPVSIGANVSYANSSSTEDAIKTASTFAKTTVEQALDRVKHTTAETRRVRTLQQTEERNFHSFDNKDGPNKSGIYRWVDKIYRQKVMRYGRRLMYEFFVPEPARFMKFANPKADTRQAPTPPQAVDWRRRQLVPLRADLVGRENYLDLAAAYGATDIQPPPAFYRTLVAKAVARQSSGQSDGTSSTGWSLAETLEIPEGYVARQVALGGQMNAASSALIPRTAGGTAPLCVITVGTRVFVPATNVPMGDTLTLRDEYGQLPLSVVCSPHMQLTLNIEVDCDITPQAFAQWQLSTFEAIMLGYSKLKADYDDRASAASVQEGVSIQGSNPLRNLQRIRDELKRQVIWLWTGLRSVTTPAVSFAPPDDEPSIDLAANDRNSFIIGLIEDSFDWENMTYQLLPAAYGSAQSLREGFQDTDPDPHFQDFQNAGYARVLVPVVADEKNLTAARLLFFQATGVPGFFDEPFVFPESWPDGQRFNAILEDLADETGIVDVRTDQAIAEDDPEAWLVRVPTTLVKLQLSMTLPGEEA